MEHIERQKQLTDSLTKPIELVWFEILIHEIGIIFGDQWSDLYIYLLYDSVFFLQGKAPKEIHTILTETLGELAPLYATIKNWVA
jgi:hypothetical protein